MRNVIKFLGIIFFVVLTSLVLTTCATSAGTPSSDSGPKYTGSGGRGISVAVRVPEAQGLLDSQNYLPTMIQGALVSAISQYSAISVLDRLRLETVLRETESGIYRSEAAYGQLGQIANVDYVLTGSVVRTGSGYTLQIQVVGTKSNNTGITRASYSGTPTVAEMDNLTGIRRASMEILTGMGVNLTESARRELSGAGSSADVQSQRVLSQGIVAQRGGNEFQAMLNYFEARTFNPNIAEASTRITSASTTLAANNFQNTGARAQVLSEIQHMREEERQRIERERALIAVLEKAAAFYRAHQPFRVWAERIRFNNINSKRNTVDISATIVVKAIEEEVAIIRALSRQASEILGVHSWPFNFKGETRYRPGMEREREKYYAVPGIWNIKQSILSSSFGERIPDVDPESKQPTFSVVVDVINEQGKKVATMSTELGRDFTTYFFNIPELTNTSGYRGSRFLNYVSLQYQNSDRDERRRQIIQNLMPIPFEEYQRLRRGRNVDFQIPFYAYYYENSKDLSRTIRANDLTDTMTTRIVSVNGRSAASIRRSGYVTLDERMEVVRRR